MATMTVWTFDTPDGAQQALSKLAELQAQQRITIADAAIVSWPVGKGKPKTLQLQNPTRIGPLSGAFWGMLFGRLFFIPLLGMAVGAGMGAIFRLFGDAGISDDFVKAVQAKVTEGTSALFLLTEIAVVAQVAAALAGLSPELIQTNLSAEQEARLRAAFGQDADPVTPG